MPTVRKVMAIKIDLINLKKQCGGEVGAQDCKSWGLILFMALVLTRLSISVYSSTEWGSHSPSVIGISWG